MSGSEVTGDTASVFTVMKSIAESDLIITTVSSSMPILLARLNLCQPEKWESVTRRSDQLAARSAPALIMIDEVLGPSLPVLSDRAK